MTGVEMPSTAVRSAGLRRTSVPQNLQRANAPTRHARRRWQAGCRAIWNRSPLPAAGTGPRRWRQPGRSCGAAPPEGGWSRWPPAPSASRWRRRLPAASHLVRGDDGAGASSVLPRRPQAHWPGDRAGRAGGRTRSPVGRLAPGARTRDTHGRRTRTKARPAAGSLGPAVGMSASRGGTAPLPSAPAWRRPAPSRGQAMLTPPAPPGDGSRTCAGPPRVPKRR